jgi:hypothetical protein
MPDDQVDAAARRQSTMKERVSGGSPDLSAASIQELSIDHHCRYIFVSQRFLDRADVIAILQQIGPMIPSITNAILDPSNRVGASSSDSNKQTKSIDDKLTNYK